MPLKKLLPPFSFKLSNCCFYSFNVVFVCVQVFPAPPPLFTCPGLVPPLSNIIATSKLLILSRLSYHRDKRAWRSENLKPLTIGMFSCTITFSRKQWVPCVMLPNSAGEKNVYSCVETIFIYTYVHLKIVIEQLLSARLRVIQKWKRQMWFLQTLWCLPPWSKHGECRQ